MKNRDKWLIFGMVTLTVVTLYSIYRNIKKPISKPKQSKLKSDEWSSDADFFKTTDGKNLMSLAQNVGITLKRNRGLDNPFNESKYQSYKNNSKVFWAIYDITNDKLIASSPNANTNVYGASVPKVCVAAAAFDNNNGTLPNDGEYQNVIKLLVKSDNNVWSGIQELAGGADAVNSWAEKMGYTMKPARGKGNNSNAIDMCRFWNDVCRDNFKGAENIFRISSSCQTDASRGRKCMPPSVYMGGKTGTYNTSNHDCCWVQDGDRFYSICVLTELGSAGSEAIAQTFRGLYNEYINNK